MGRKKHLSLSSIDFNTGIIGKTPSTKEAFVKDGEFSELVRKEESTNLKLFQQNLRQKIDQEIKSLSQFPTEHEVFVFIIQYFISEKDYKNRDIDNMAKTILDVLIGKFYKNDSQVKTLLVHKKMDRKIEYDFVYIAVTEIKDNRDIEIVKKAGIDRALTTYYKEVKKVL